MKKKGKVKFSLEVTDEMRASFRYLTTIFENLFYIVSSKSSVNLKGQHTNDSPSDERIQGYVEMVESLMRSAGFPSGWDFERVVGIKEVVERWRKLDNSEPEQIPYKEIESLIAKLTIYQYAQDTYPEHKELYKDLHKGSKNLGKYEFDWGHKKVK